MHYEANTAEPDQTACGECPNQDLPYLPIPYQFGLAGVELRTFIYLLRNGTFQNNYIHYKDKIKYSIHPDRDNIPRS